VSDIQSDTELRAECQTFSPTPDSPEHEVSLNSAVYCGMSECLELRDIFLNSLSYCRYSLNIFVCKEGHYLKFCFPVYIILSVINLKVWLRVWLRVSLLGEMDTVPVDACSS